MPYKRKYKRSFSKGRALTKKQTRQVKTIVKRVIDPETKIFPIFDSESFSSSATILDLSAISAGTSSTTRIGNEVMVHKIVVKGRLIGNTDEYNAARIMIIRWRESDNEYALNDVTDVLDSSGSGSTYPPYYPLNYFKRDSFVVLYDKTFDLASTFAFTSGGSTTSSMSQRPVKTINININRKFKIQYTGATATSGSGKLYMLLVSDSVPATSHPSFEFAGQVHYTDA